MILLMNNWFFSHLWTKKKKRNKKLKQYRTLTISIIIQQITAAGAVIPIMPSHSIWRIYIHSFIFYFIFLDNRWKYFIFCVSIVLNTIILSFLASCYFHTSFKAQTDLWCSLDGWLFRARLPIIVSSIMVSSFQFSIWMLIWYNH